MSQRPNVFRRKLLIDKKVQLKLIAYSMFMSIVFSSFAFASYQVWKNRIADQLPPPVAPMIAIVLAGIGVLAFIFILGLIITNQVAGPIYRLRTQMRAVADGATPQPLYVRKGDTVEDLFEDYNRMIARLAPTSKPVNEKES